MGDIEQRLIEANQRRFEDLKARSQFDRWPCYPGQIWRHSGKGTDYQVLAIANSEQGQLIVYAEADTGWIDDVFPSTLPWARPAEMWCQVVRVGGIPTARFTFQERMRRTYRATYNYTLLPSTFYARHTETGEFIEVVRSQFNGWLWEPVDSEPFLETT